MICSVRNVPLWYLLAVVASGPLACTEDPTSGVDADLLAQAYASAREIPGIRSLLVQRHGVLVGEEYFHGAAADSLYEVLSVTKSVVSILTGIALEHGYITSLDQTLDDFLPPIVDTLPADKGRITLRQLLTMTSGLEWHELDGGGEFNRWASSNDMVQYVIDRPWASPPGTTFHYNSGATHLLSVALTEATGTSMLDFARQYLFGPLGITQVDWATDERGYCIGGAGLQLRPRDMVKIGELFLRGGKWQGSRVVASAWVEQSTSAQVSTGNVILYGPEYGYLWWIGRRQASAFYFAMGYAGQFILVAPDAEVVVVATSDWRGLSWNGAGAQWRAVVEIIVDQVLPAVGG